MGRIDHKEYLKFIGILDGLRHEQICNFKLDEVFMNEFTCRDGERVTVLEYLEVVLNQAYLAIDQIKDQDKQQLTLDKLLELHHKY